MSTMKHDGPSVKVDAYDWARSITGKRWDVATQEQRDFAVELLNRDHLLGAKIVPPGPSLEELDALLAAREPREAPKPKPAPPKPQQPAPAPWANAWKPSPAERAAMRTAVESFDAAVDKAYARSYPAEVAAKAEAPDAYAAVHEHLEACDGHLADFHRNMAEFDRQIAAFDATVAEILEDEDSDPAEWPAWTDDDRWTIGPDPDDHDWSEYAAWSEGRLEQEHDDAPAPAMTLDAWIDAEARRYRALRTQAGELVADALVELAASVRLTQATTPRTARDRMEALEARHAALATV